MAILRNDTTVRSADGQTTSAIITAANIGNYGISTTSTYYIGTTQNVFNRASGAQTLTGVSIDGNAANITAYTINQNVGTGNAPSFTGMTSTAMLVASTSMNSVDDWQNSPISIRERGLVAAAQSANTYSPNLNFHWASRISNSLWMDANGNLSWGSYDGTGVPSSDGAFYVNNLYASIYFDKNNTSYYLDPANTGTSLLVAGNVGIGNTSPSAKLHVLGASYTTASAANNNVRFEGGGGNGLGFGTIDATSTYASWIQSGYVPNFATATYALLLNPLGGNVGIGTTSPTYKLDVSGTARIANDMLATGNITIAKSAAYLILDGTNSDAEIYWRANSSNRWAAGMNVGDATENFNIYNYTTATTNFTILKASGNVGIGSTNPSQKLHVVGTGFASTDFRAPIFYDSDNTTYYLDPNASTSGNLFGVLKQNDGKFVRDSYFRTISGIGDYYASGASGWYTVASITLTTNCTGGVLYGTLYDNRYDGADTYQIAIVARAECDFTTNNESHYVNVGCTILGSTGITNYQSKIRVLLVASSANSRTYEVQFFETSWNRDTWQLETGGSPVWTIYSTAQAPGTSTGTARVFYVSNKNADNIRANTASYSPIYYDSNDTSYYSDPAGLNRFNALNIGNQGALTGNTTYALGAYHNSRYMVGLRYSSGGAAYPWLVHDSWNGSAFVIHFNGVGDKFNFSESGIGQAGGDFRAPIFYDSNNTAYYIDAASTSVLNALTVGGNNVLTTASTLTAGNLSGTIPSAVLGNSTLYVGTTAITLNRASASQSLTGVNIDGSSGSCTGNAATASLATTSDRLTTRDNRTISPSEDDAYRLRYGFTSWANNDSSPYADYLHLRSYSDSSGGNDNLVMFRKDAIGMRIWQQTFGSTTAYATYKDVAFTDQSFFIGTTSVAINRASASQTLTGISIDGNAATATTLQTARTINGTSFNGSANITTSSWGTARTLTIGSTGKSVDGSAAVAWSLAEIGAAATNQTMFIGTTSVAINRASASQTLTGVSIDGNAATASNATQFGGEANTNFMRGLAGGTEANINNYTDNGFRTVAYTGHGKGLLSFNVGSSIGTVQQEYFYNIPTNGWRVRNKTDSTTWSSWGNVVMTDTNQGALTGTVITTGNSSGLSPTFSNLYAAVFYDSGNTAFYVDPASTSILNTLMFTSEITLSKHNARNLLVKGAGGSDSGILGRGSSDQFAFQLYGSGSGSYGFLDGAWAGWDIRKVVDGDLFLNDNNTYYLNPGSTTNLNNLTVAGTMTFGTLAYTTGSRRSKNSSNVNIETVTGLVSPSGPTFIEIRGFCPPTMYRTTGDRPAPYGLGFGNGSESGGIMPIGAGDNLQEIMLYGANSGPTTFTFKRQIWEATTQDPDGSNYYGSSVFSINTGTGAVTASTDIRSPIFYDNNDTSYYIDPASTSVINILQFAANTAQIIGNTSSSYGSLDIRGVRNGWRGIHFNAGGNAPHLMFDGSANGGVYFETGGRWASYYSYGNNCWGFGTSTTSSSYNIYVGTGIYSGGRVDGTIFYDSNDSTYYVDPASFSLISSLGIGGLTSSNNVQMYDSYVDASSSYLQSPPLIIRKDSSATGAIDQAPVGLFIYNLNGTNNTWTKFSMGSREAAGAGNTVSIAGLAAQKTAGTANSWATGNLHFWTKAGGTQITNMVAYSSGYVQSDYSFRAPIFYDSNNTSYYLDPLSTSVLNRIDLPSGSAAINTTTPGTLAYQLNFTGQGTADNAQAITWGWSTSGAQAGIYVQSSGGYGTKMYIATTDSFATGSKTAITIDHTGVVTTNRNYLQATGSLRAPIFYDSDNTGYYLDPASTSNLNIVNLVGMSGAGGAYIQSTTTGTSYSNHIQIRESSGGGGNTSEIYAPALGFHWSGVVASNILMESSGRIAIRNNPGSGYENFIANAIYGAVFYDSNDTTYYTDPAGTSYLNNSIFNGLSSADYTRQFAPSGGYYYEGGSVTGAIKIRLPANSKTLYPMLSFTCHIYNYSTGTSRTFKIGGHFSSSSWYNPFAYCLSESGSNLNVRWGYEGNYLVVWIGETNTGWSYPCVFITDFQNGYSAINNSWMVGWNVSRVTAFDTVTNGPTAAGFFWNQNNDGSGSGLDADLVDGLEVHTARNDNANKIVRTDSNGYIQAGWINTTSGDNGTNALDRIYASSDAYIRYYTPANFRTVLDVPTRGGSGASGSWGISITGSSASCTGNSATATTASSCSGNSATATTATNAGCITSDTGNVGDSRLQYWQTSGNTTLNPDTEWYNAIRMGHGNPVTYYSNTLAVKMTGSNLGDIYTRTTTNGTAGTWNRFWNNNNDGAGSGLDADLLDGINSASFLRSDVSATNSVDLRSPIYYDSDNTTYYINAGGISNLLGLTVVNTITGNISGNAGTVSAGVYTNTNQNITGEKYFQSNLGTTSGSLSSPPLQVYSTGTNAAFMSFHRAGNYAVNMGLDSDNVLRIGGWSASANRLQLDMSGNLTLAGVVDATQFRDSANTAYYVDPASTSILNLVRTRNTYGERIAVNASSPITIDTQYSVTELTLIGSISSMSFSNIQASGIVHMWTIVTVGNATAYTITWPAAVKWPGGTAPTVTTANTKRDIYQFVTYDGGTNIYAIIVGQNL